MMATDRLQGRNMEYRDPEALVQTDWLEAHLADPNLRIFDCTTYLKPAEPGSDMPYLIVSGRADSTAGIFQAPVSSIFRASCLTTRRSCGS